MDIEIVFKNLFPVDLPLVPVNLGYHAQRLLPMLRRLNNAICPAGIWKGESLEDLVHELSLLNFWASPHGLRLGLRDLMDCGAIGLKPDPRFEPLI